MPAPTRSELYSINSSRWLIASVLYPGDLYDVGHPQNSIETVKKYSDDEKRRSTPLRINDEVFTPAQLDKLSADHQTKIRVGNSIWLFRPIQWLGKLPPVNIHLTDIGKSLSYSMFDGIKWSTGVREAADIEFNSAAMARMLRYGTGYDTLYISGRFTERRRGSRFVLGRHFMVLRRNESGQYFPSTFLNPSFICARIRLMLKGASF